MVSENAGYQGSLDVEFFDFFCSFHYNGRKKREKRGYEVFLSFRGSDVRRGFLSHFYDALTSAGFTVFLDNSEINIGDDISAALHHAIQISGIFIIVFSRNFAESPWCLKEAALIARRVLQTNGKDKEAGIAIPIFYDVTPSQVRHPDSSPFAEAFKEHEGSGKYSQSEIDEWKAALRTISDLRGLSLQEDANGYEAALVKRVVEDVGKLCNRRTLAIIRPRLKEKLLEFTHLFSEYNQKAEELSKEHHEREIIYSQMEDGHISTLLFLNQMGI